MGLGGAVPLSCKGSMKGAKAFDIDNYGLEACDVSGFTFRSHLASLEHWDTDRTSLSPMHEHMYP